VGKEVREAGEDMGREGEVKLFNCSGTLLAAALRAREIRVIVPLHQRFNLLRVCFYCLQIFKDLHLSCSITTLLATI